MTSRYINVFIDNDMTMNDFSPDASQVAEVGSQAELTLRALQIAFYCAVQRSNNACWTQNSAKKLMYVDFSLQAKLTFREISEEARGMSVLDRAVVFLGRLIFINGSTYGLGVNLMICQLAVFIRRLHVFPVLGLKFWLRDGRHAAVTTCRPRKVVTLQRSVILQQFCFEGGFVSIQEW